MSAEPTSFDLLTLELLHNIQRFGGEEELRKHRQALVGWVECHRGRMTAEELVQADTIIARFDVVLEGGEG
jgi:hypothetical protein